MKKTLIVIVLLINGRLLAIAPIGPTASPIKKGQSSLGFEYGRTEADYTVKALGFAIDSEAKSNGFYGRYAYGIADGSELFVRFGAAKFAGESDIDVTSPSGYDFAWGFGAKTTLAESANVRWGIAAQVTWWQAESAVTTADYSLHEADKGYSVQIAGGPVFRLDGLSLYGGPVLFFAEADAHGTFRVADTAVKLDADVEQGLQLGGYIGLSLELAKTVDLGVEYQLSADTAVFGVGLTCRF